jgi:hypothetical protein
MNFSFARLGVAAGILAFSSGCITDATVDLTKAPFNATTDVTDASTDATSRLTDGTSQGDRDRFFENAQSQNAYIYQKGQPRPEALRRLIQAL